MKKNEAPHKKFFGFGLKSKVTKGKAKCDIAHPARSREGVVLSTELVELDKIHRMQTN